ncbi:hypothetical protein C8R31_10495 [Nitrosospira sp. Nsp2]|nr:hypothetical protein C8R31_10495 [Nitrosospira sp. Nsp2]
MQDAVGGWGSVDLPDTYGLGYVLDYIKVWLDKVALAVI